MAPSMPSQATRTPPISTTPPRNWPHPFHIAPSPSRSCLILVLWTSFHRAYVPVHTGPTRDDPRELHAFRLYFAYLLRHNSRINSAAELHACAPAAFQSPASAGSLWRVRESGLSFRWSHEAT